MQQIISSSTMRMTSVEIAELVGSRHDSVKRTVERLAEGGVISLPPLVEVKTQRERRLETSQAYIFEGEKGKRDSIECEKRLKQVVNKPVPLLSPKEEDFRVLEFIANSLRLPDSGKLEMYEKYCKHQAPQLLPALPSYAVDSPTGSTAGSSELTFPVLESVNMKKQTSTQK